MDHDFKYACMPILAYSVNNAADSAAAAAYVAAIPPLGCCDFSHVTLSPCDAWVQQHGCLSLIMVSVLAKR